MNDSKLAPTSYDAMAHQATQRADEAIDSARKAADGALDSLQDKASQLAAVAPGTLSRVAAQIDDITSRGIERARAATATAREQAQRAGDRTVSYIKDEPVKSVLIAAAAGAAIATLIGLVARTKSVERG
jgi:ElaB/YqjD/DUF883 family membrane-anchored ribosome-binding protein